MFRLGSLDGTGDFLVHQEVDWSWIWMPRPSTWKRKGRRGGGRSEKREARRDEYIKMEVFLLISCAVCETRSVSRVAKTLRFRYLHSLVLDY